MARLSFIPPELREDRGEIALAKPYKLPHLVSLPDIRGDLRPFLVDRRQTSIEAIARAALALGYEYVALTDHRRRIAMAPGLDAAALSQQPGKSIE